MMPLQSYTANHLINALGWSLVHFLWQGAFLSALVYTALLLLRKSSPAARYAAACTGMAVMALCPLVTACLLLPEQTPNGRQTAEILGHAVRSNASPLVQVSDGSSMSEAPVNTALLHGGGATASLTTLTPSTVVQPRAVHLVTLSSRLLSQVVWLWLTGVLLLSIRLFGGLIGLSRLRRRNTFPASAGLQHSVTMLAQQMGIRAKVVLLESARVQVPAVVGSFRSVILVPGSALTGLPTAQLEAILAHELAHIRRHDSLINLLQVAIETVLFYHPAVWWVSHRIRVEREHCCDDLAIETLGDRVTYARALTALEEIRGVSAQLAMAATGGDLLARVRRVLGRRTSTFSPTPATTAGVLSMLLCTALGLAVFHPAQSSPVQTHSPASEAALIRSRIVSARRGEIASIVSGALRLTLSSLSDLVGADNSGRTLQRNRATDSATLSGDTSLDRSNAAFLEPVALRQTVDPSSAPLQSGPQSHSNTADPAGQGSTDTPTSGADAHPDSATPQSRPQTHGTTTDSAGQSSTDAPESGADSRPDQGADAQDSNRDAHSASQPAHDRQQAQRDADHEGLDSVGAQLDGLDREIEALGRQMDDKVLTAQQRAALAARISRLGVELGSRFVGDISAQVRSALDQSMRQMRGGLQAQIDQALRQAETEVRRALQQADVAANVSRALRDAHIDEHVNRALRDAHIDQQVQRAMREAHVDDQVQRALRDAHIQDQIQHAMRDVHAAEQVQRALRDAHVADHVQRALRDAHVSDQVQRALRDAHVAEQVQRAMRDAHVTDQIQRALQEASNAVDRALKQANIEIQRSTADHDTSSHGRSDDNADGDQ